MGGALGAWCRFALQQKMPFQWANVTVSTLVINAVGGFMMGSLAAWLMSKSAADQLLWRALLMSGFCGGFTTFWLFLWKCGNCSSRETHQCHRNGIGSCWFVFGGGDVGLVCCARQCALTTLRQEPCTQLTCQR